MKSTIASHPDRAAIEAGLARRVPYRKIGKRYGVTIDALFRYKRRMLRDQPELFLKVQAKDWGKVRPEELEALRLETSENWLKNIRADLGKVLYFRDVCIADNDHQAAAAWTGHATRYFKLLGEAVEHLRGHTVNIQNNFYNAPDYSLIPHPILAAFP